MKNAKGAARASIPAEIVITVTQFRAVLSAKEAGEVRDTGYEMKMKRPHSRVSLKDDTLFVKSPGAVIRLTIASPAKDKTRYYPAGITFVRDGGNGLTEADRLGRKDFLQRRITIDGLALKFTDRFQKGKEKTLYKISVILQRGSDGAIGIIDPGIENEGTQP